MTKIVQTLLFLLLIIICGCSKSDSGKLSTDQTDQLTSLNFDSQQLPEEYDLLAPDNSEIRLLTKTNNGSMVHCRLPPGQTSIAVTHRTIDELWYFIGGEGEVWMKNAETEYQQVIPVKPGTALSNPLGTHFQFRNTGDKDLDFVIVSMPPWPGADEAIKVEGKWD